MSATHIIKKNRVHEGPGLINQSKDDKKSMNNVHSLEPTEGAAMPASMPWNPRDVNSPPPQELPSLFTRENRSPLLGCDGGPQAANPPRQMPLKVVKKPVEAEFKGSASEMPRVPSVLADEPRKMAEDPQVSARVPRVSIRVP